MAAAAAAHQRSKDGGPGGEGCKIFRTDKGTFIAEASDLLGKGTYGVVYRVRDEKDPTIVKAVKTFSPDTMDENEGIPSTTLREINALRSIDHPNVMTAEDVVIPAERSLTDMFVVMELCRGTLKDKMINLIEQNMRSASKWLAPPPQFRLPNDYIKEAKIVAWQLLNALAATHSRGVMHRDLKPVNIMWSSDDLLKIGDFGLARFVRGSQNSKNTVMPQTGEVQTMWYRAPEVLLGDERYGMKVDDWSIGCIIAELFRFRKSSSGRIETAPIFHGRSDVDTLMMIFDALGTPRPDSEISHVYLSELPYWSPEYPKWTSTLRERVPLIDDQGFDLLKQLLCVSPCERQASKFLLQHPWFHDVREEIQRFVPWFRGLEAGYEKMVAVDRLSPAKPLKSLQKRSDENCNANNRKARESKPQVICTRNTDVSRVAKDEALFSNTTTSNTSSNSLAARDPGDGAKLSNCVPAPPLVRTTSQFPSASTSTTTGVASGAAHPSLSRSRSHSGNPSSSSSSLGSQRFPSVAGGVGSRILGCSKAPTTSDACLDATSKKAGLMIVPPDQVLHGEPAKDPVAMRSKRGPTRARAAQATATTANTMAATQPRATPGGTVPPQSDAAWPLMGRSRSPERAGGVLLPVGSRRRRQPAPAAASVAGAPGRRSKPLAFVQRLASDDTGESSVAGIKNGDEEVLPLLAGSVKIGGRRAAIVARGSRLVTVSTAASETSLDGGAGGARLICRRGGRGGASTLAGAGAAHDR